MLFAFRLANGAPARKFELPGLGPERNYRLTSPDGWSATFTGAMLAGGLTFEAEEPFRAAIIAIEVASDGTEP